VQHRRSQRCAITPADFDGAPKDQTVFIKAFRLGPRSLYQRSFARKVMMLMNRSSRHSGDKDYFGQSLPEVGGSFNVGGSPPGSLPSPTSASPVDDVDVITSNSFECPVSCIMSKPGT
jgi:hypothetical protein